MRARDLTLSHENKSFPLASLIPKKMSDKYTSTSWDIQNSTLSENHGGEKETGRRRKRENIYFLPPYLFYVYNSLI